MSPSRGLATAAGVLTEVPSSGCRGLLRTAFSAAPPKESASAGGDEQATCDFKAMMLGNQMGRWRTNDSNIAHAYQHDLKGVEVPIYWPGRNVSGQCKDVNDFAHGCWYRSRLLNDIGCQDSARCLHFAAHDGEATYTYTCPTWVADPFGRRCKLPEGFQACPDKFTLQSPDTGVPQSFEQALQRPCGLHASAHKLVGSWTIVGAEDKWSVNVNDVGQLAFRGKDQHGRIKGTLVHQPGPEGWWQTALRDDNDIENGEQLRMRLTDKGEIESQTKQEGDKEWMPSMMSYKDIPTYGGTANGQSCVFPFEYKGEQHFSCATADEKAPWCKTATGEWGYCSDKVPKPDAFKVMTHGGTGHGSSCMFPFTHKGKQHTGCVTEDGAPWCATDDMGHWGYCNCKVMEEGTDEHPIPVHGGTAAAGAHCKFPFEHNGKDHHACVDDGKNAPWCMTDDAGKWGFCGCKAPLEVLQTPTGEKQEDTVPSEGTEQEPTHTDHCRGSTVEFKAVHMIFNIRQNMWYRCSPEYVCEPFDIKGIQDFGGAEGKCGAETCKEDELCFEHLVDSKTSTHECVPRREVWAIGASEVESGIPAALAAAAGLPARLRARSWRQRPVRLRGDRGAGPCGPAGPVGGDSASRLRRRLARFL